MRFIVLILALSLLATAQAADAPKTVVYFSPNGGCTAAVVDALGKAKKTVLVQAYPFTSAPIASVPPCHLVLAVA